MSENKDPLITVGLPTLDREQELLDTINMVLSQNYENIELIVADQSEKHDAKTQTRIAELRQIDSRFKYHKIAPKNLPAARNFILEQANGKLILFIDDDIQIEKNFIRLHVEAHKTNPGVAAVGGRVTQTELPISSEVLRFDELGFPHNTFNCRRSMRCTTFPGGNHSVNTSILRSIGGYHTSYTRNALREESDLAHRLIVSGHSIYFEPKAKIFHLFIQRGGSRIFTQQYDNIHFYINDLLFVLRTVQTKKIISALYAHFKAYTDGPTFKNRSKRKVYFLLGLLLALKRYFIPLRIKAREV